MRRLLFVRSSRTPRKPRFYLTLAALAALGAISVDGAFRSYEPAAAALRPSERPPPPGKASDGGEPIPLPLRTPGAQSRWM